MAAKAAVAIVKAMAPEVRRGGNRSQLTVTVFVNMYAVWGHMGVWCAVMCASWRSGSGTGADRKWKSNQQLAWMD